MDDTKRLKEVIENLELETLLEEEFAEEIRVVDVEKNYIEEMYGNSEGLAWYIVDGWVKGTTFFGEGREMKWDLRTGNWFGIEEAILGYHFIYDIEIMRDSVILELPIKKIYESDNTSTESLKAIIWHMAMAKKFLEDTVIERIGFSDEGFFLKYLENNEFNISYRNQKDISDVLAINERTFQRILKALDEKGVISIKRGNISVTGKDTFYRYIKENKLWE